MTRATGESMGAYRTPDFNPDFSGRPSDLSNGSSGVSRVADENGPKVQSSTETDPEWLEGVLDLAERIDAQRAVVAEATDKLDGLKASMAALVGETYKGKHGDYQIEVRPTRRFDERRALDLLAGADELTRIRCITSQNVERVNRETFKLTAPQLEEQAWNTVGSTVIVKAATR